MKVMVVGSGGREHTLCWKLNQSPVVNKIFCAPGNAGIAEVAECVDIDVCDLEKLADFAKKEEVDFAVVGPEAPLCAGLVDVLKENGIKVFGPSKIAAQLEGSKDFAKQFMLNHNIPTAKAASFSSAKPAEEYIRNEFAEGAKGIVIKADGLAAGKGVCVADEVETAVDFMRSCFEGVFGGAGSQVLVEECLFGEEASILALTDGKTIVPLVSSQDHKRAYDNDEGPNTGGMGAYSPAPVVDDEIMAQVNSQILDNFLKGIQEDGLDFKGLLFVGVMVTENGPKVLEFNVRFGDPEVQAVMCRLDSDLLGVMMKTAEGKLSEAELVWSDDPAVCVVMASGGYPGSYKKGYEITGLDAAAEEGAVVFHAGTSKQEGKIVNTGGRVLGVTARGKDIAAAIANAYRAVDKIHWQDCFCRRDIGFRALAREK
ncbi:MAG: phosphoribosylamine--glycine ligase [Lentisphaerae bacterium]|nr:phosphoribosylamine--glycine ligase [Lentisphaerota bacterium]MCP4102501.1 phosphoribosylamine--glycine ligase [Lentisphaerota bacterium]